MNYELNVFFRCEEGGQEVVGGAFSTKKTNQRRHGTSRTQTEASVFGLFCDGRRQKNPKDLTAKTTKHQMFAATCLKPAMFFMFWFEFFGSDSSPSEGLIAAFMERYLRLKS